MSKRKYKKVNALAKAKMLTYVAENWVGKSGKHAKDCLRRSSSLRRKDFQIIGIETETSTYSIEFGVKRISDQVYKELYGSYPDGGLMSDSIKPVKWHREIAEALVGEGLVK